MFKDFLICFSSRRFVFSPLLAGRKPVLFGRIYYKK